MRAARSTLTAVFLGGLLAGVVGCGGGSGPAWGMDPDIVGIWDLIEMTEDGVPLFFRGKVMRFEAGGALRSDSFSGQWSIGTYRTRPGKLNYTITDSSDPDNINRTFTLTYDVSGGTLVIEGRSEGAYYVSTFTRIGLP